jgi:hypothetical protein
VPGSVHAVLAGGDREKVAVGADTSGNGHAAAAENGHATGNGNGAKRE